MSQLCIINHHTNTELKIWIFISMIINNKHIVFKMNYKYYSALIITHKTSLGFFLIYRVILSEIRIYSTFFIYNMTVNTYCNNKIYKNIFIKHCNLNILDLMNKMRLLPTFTIDIFQILFKKNICRRITILYINKNVIPI